MYKCTHTLYVLQTGFIVYEILYIISDEMLFLCLLYMYTVITLQVYTNSCTFLIYTGSIVSVFFCIYSDRIKE